MQTMIRESNSHDLPDVERFIQRKLQGELSAPKDVAAATVEIVARSPTSGCRMRAAEFAV